MTISALRCLLCLLIGCAVLPAAAQSIERHPITFPEQRSCVFTCLCWDGTLNSLYYRTLEARKPGEKVLADQMHGQLVLNAVKTEAPNGTRSRPVGYKGPQLIEFYRIPPPVTPVKKEFEPDPIASVNLPANLSRMLLLFIPQPPPPDHPSMKWRIQVLPDSLEDLPLGNYLLFNATPKKLLGSYSDRSFELASGTSMLRKVDWPSGVDLEWRFWEADNPERPVHTSLWRHKQDGRYIIFILAGDSASSALQVNAITEYGEPPPPLNPPPK